MEHNLQVNKAKQRETLEYVLPVRYTEAADQFRLLTGSNQLIDLIGLSFLEIVDFCPFSPNLIKE